MSWSEQIMDATIEYGVCLPLTLTAGSKSRCVRLLGLALYVPWFVPAGVLSLPVMIIALLAIMVESTWKGEF